MNPRGLFKGLSNPNQLTWRIVDFLLGIGRLAFFDLAKFNLKWLAGKLFGLPGHEVEQLPKRYRFPAYFFAVLATVHLWMGVITLIFPMEDNPSIFYSLGLTIIFYSLALFTIWLYPRRFVYPLWQLLGPRLLEIGRRLIRVIRNLRRPDKSGKEGDDEL